MLSQQQEKEYKKKLDDLWNNGKILDESDEKLRNYLKELSTYYTFDDSAYSINILRVSIINSIRQQRHIDKIETRNTIYTWIIIILTIVGILANLQDLVKTIQWFYGFWYLLF